MIDWIQGEKFQKIANYTFAPRVLEGHDYLHFGNTLNLDLLKDGDIIYVQGFIGYMQKLLSVIKDTKKVIIVSNNCDHCVDSSFVMPDNVIRWYARNVNVDDPRIESIPSGLENNHWRPEMKKKEKIIDKLQEERKIKNLVYMDHAISWNVTERSMLYEIFSGVTWMTRVKNKSVSYETYIDNVYNHKFAICPAGNGMSTHRPWEALYLGTIPIQRLDLDSRFYTDLPICFVESWKQINEKFLNKEYERIRSISTWKMEMLTFEYWKNKILNTPY